MGCSTCHGENAEGTGEGDDAVPSLVGVGAAAADFQLRTGRMPLAVIGKQAVRKPPAYGNDEIEALVAYVASLGPGPGHPRGRRGRPPTRSTAASCSEPTARRATTRPESVARCRTATTRPRCCEATPTEVVEAMRTGPGQMPVFGPDTFTDDEATDIAAYVTGNLQHPDNRGGFALGSTGPVPEGFVAWTVGFVVIGAAVFWVVRGRRRAAA